MHIRISGKKNNFVPYQLKLSIAVINIIIIIIKNLLTTVLIVTMVIAVDRMSMFLYRCQRRRCFYIDVNVAVVVVVVVVVVVIRHCCHWYIFSITTMVVVNELPLSIYHYR
jgi:hypothetical protein